MSKATKISKTLNEVFGEEKQDVRVIMPKAFLANLSKELSISNKAIEEAVAKNNTKEELKTIIADNKELRNLMSNLENAIYESRVDRVEVANFPKSQKQKDFPKKIGVDFVGKPKWYKEFSDNRLVETLEKGLTWLGKQLSLDKYQKKENALAVKLVTKDGKDFYTAWFQAISGGSSSSGGTTGGGDASAANQTLMVNLLTTIDANQTNGTQAIQIVDAGGDAVTVTGSKLDVNASVDTTGLATSVKQLADNHNVTVSNPTADPETGLATSAKQLADGHSVAIVPPTTVGNGNKVVTTGGTAEALGASTAIESVTIKALVGNTNNVYVGDSGVDNTNGFVLGAGDTISLDIDNLTDIYLDVDTDGEGVSFIYVT